MSKYAHVQTSQGCISNTAHGIDDLSELRTELDFALLLIGQMDWFNSAGMLYGGWKTRFPVPAIPHGLEALQTSGVATSRGYRLAGLLREEIGRAMSRASHKQQQGSKPQ
jgi:hypothetical protein